MKEIALTQGFVAIVDDEDYEYLSQYKWHFGGGYARRNVPHPTRPGKRTTLKMHRAIMGLDFDDEREVDHIDGAGLNNQRANLRVCLHEENVRNKSRHSNNRSGLKGASADREKWKAQITANGRNIYLGLFDTAEEAHAAYRKAAAALHGEYANSGEGQIGSGLQGTAPAIDIDEWWDKHRKTLPSKARAVTCAESGQTFISQALAATWLVSLGNERACSSAIRNVCTGRAKTAYGFTWLFADGQAEAA